MALLQSQELLIPSSFGRDMAADLTYAIGSKSLVVYAHGINGFKDWGGMNLIAKRFASRGLSFLKFNYSHNGTTPEEPTQFSDLEAYGRDNYSIRQSDLKSVFNFILSGGVPIEVDQFILIGHSRGGADAIIFAKESAKPDVLLTWAAPHEANTPWSKWDKEKMKAWKEEGVQYMVNGRTQQKMPLYHQLYEDVETNFQRYNLTANAEEISMPWLIVHGKEDEAVDPSSATRLKKHAKEAELCLIDGTGHTFDRTHPWENDKLPPASKQLCDESIAFIKKSI